jgi:hypothetical protein
MHKTSQEYRALYESLYDPSATGVVLLRQVISPAIIDGTVHELKSNQRNFVKRPLHYGTTLQELSSWDFEREVLRNYTYLSKVEERYDEISSALHAQMDVSSQVDEIQVNVSHYAQNSIGIGPHRDNTFSVNFTAIFIITGENEFCTAEAKECEHEVCYPTTPGDCIVLRGPRSYEERDLRPIHYVKAISKERYIVTFREINHEYLNQTRRDSQLNA